MMKRLACLLGLALFSTLACGDPPPPDIAAPLSSRVELAAGDVFLSAEGEERRLITGAMLPKDANLTVGEGGRALIRMGTGTGVFLRGGTKLKIESGNISLVKGELWTDVPADEREMGHFLAGDVKITASGAGLDIAFDGKSTTVYVARGLAVVASPGGRTEVQSGEQVLVKGKAEPVVEPVSFWEDWTGGMADRELSAGMGGRAAGRIYGIDRDRPGSPPQELQITSQSVKIYIRDGISHTTVDQRFFNPTSLEVEGWYWFTVPEGASVERFAWEVNGVLVDGEMIERKQAAATYEAAVATRAFEPALLEWVDGRTFRARIFPVPATGEKRVVLSYTELLPLADGVYRYVYPMSGDDDLKIQEFSLKADLGDEGEEIEISTLQDARVEEDGKTVSMRRSGFTPRSDFLLEMRPKEKVEPIRVMRFASGKDEADYLMVRYSPEVEWNKQKEIPGDVVVVLDTSAGGDDSERQVRADVVEAILRALSKGDRFAVVATDLKPRVLYPEKGLALAEEAQVSAAVENLAEVSSAGATDLGEMFGAALELVHDAEQPAVVYVGDGLATVGETSPDELADRLRRSMGDSRARLFTIAVGADADFGLLERLARVGGGRSFRIDNAEQTVQEALKFAGMLKTPTVTELEIDAGSGLDQVFTTAAGKVSEGEEIVMLARTHHALPDSIRVSGRIGGEKFEREYKTDEDKGSEYGYIPSLWARLYLERLMGEGLEERRGSIISLGLSFGLMTPFTSFLVLESPDAYMRQGIKRRSRYQRWSAFDRGESSVKIADAKDAAGIPLLLFGCSAMEDSSAQREVQEEQVASLIEELEKLQQSPSSTSSPSPAASPMNEPEEAAKEYDEAPMKSSKKKSGARRGLSDDPLSGMDGLLGGAVAEEKAPSMPKPAPKGSGRSFGSLGTAGPGGGGGGAKVDLSKIAIPNPYEDADQNQNKQIFSQSSCSDASRRPLSQRRVLWQRRLESASAPAQYLRIFKEAGERCELPRWRQRRVMLDLIESKSNSPAEVRTLLSVFSAYPSAQKYLRRKIMRRTLDPDLTMGLYFPYGVDWNSVQRGLAALKTPEKRLEELRKILEKRPSDAMGRTLLVHILIENELIDDARAEASRLRRDGLAGPSILSVLCDLQAEAGMIDEAKRTCSELVEFNSNDAAARQKLGDLFLRHGWYEAAYRQYKTLVEVHNESASAMLRLAASAAGMGKIDEALRIERKVASGDGEPGPDDPRRWARLHSAVRLAAMILEAKKNNEADKLGALERSLKRTQVFGAKSSLVFVVWEDLEVDFKLEATRGRELFPVSEQIDAGLVGLKMMDLGTNVPSDLNLNFKLKGAPLRRTVGYSMYTISFDGKNFNIVKKDGELAAFAEEVLLLGEAT